jgi:hypothetical protein
MRSNYNNFGYLEQSVRGALMQAEQLMRSGRVSPLQSQQKNMQMFRVTPNNTATAAGRGRQQSVAGVSQDNAGLRPDSEVYREAPAEPSQGQGAAGARAANASGTVSANTAGAARTAGAVAGANGGADTGKTEAASAPFRGKAPDNYEKQLRLNFNEDNLLSGIIMAEVLGKPRCLRRGRW